MIRLPCPNCKAIFESATEQTATIYCRDCGFVIRDTPPSVLDPASQWLYAKNRQKVGPVPLQELQRLLGSGQLLPSDMVLQAGTQKWGAASTVPGLLPTSPPAPNQAPPPNALSWDDEWYCVQDRKKIGPLSQQALQRLIGAGTIKPGDMLLKEGTQKWAAASTVPQFAALFPPQPAASAPAKPAVPPVPVSVDGWFYVKNGKKAGPAPTPEIRRLVASGELAADALVLRVGAQKWAALSSIPELAPPVAAAPAPRPAAPQLPERPSIPREEAKPAAPLPAPIAAVTELPKPPPLPTPPPLPATPPPLPAMIAPPPLPVAPPPLPPALEPSPRPPEPIPEWPQMGWPEAAEQSEPVAEAVEAEWPEAEAQPAVETVQTEWPPAEAQPGPLTEEAPVSVAAPEVAVVGTGKLGALLRKILGRGG